jgi:hypothetical protein
VWPVFTSPIFWLALLMVPVFVNMRDFAWRYYKRMYHTQAYHVVQEIHKFNIPDYRPRQEWFRKAVAKVRLTQRMRRGRGFSFSQGETGQLKLIRAYDTTQYVGMCSLFGMRCLMHLARTERSRRVEIPDTPIAANFPAAKYILLDNNVSMKTIEFG